MLLRESSLFYGVRISLATTPIVVAAGVSVVFVAFDNSKNNNDHEKNNNNNNDQDEESVPRLS